MKTQFGFTLIEMLFVLSVFLVMASVSAVWLRPQYLMFEKEKFYTQLKGDLLYAQQYAISRQQLVVVYMRPQENKYLIMESSGGKPIVEREISQAIKLGQGTLKPIFQFNKDGRIAQFGTIKFSAGEQNYVVTIQIGVGRIKIVKE
ncbi:competence type IV pilus minor pilin ComGD [Bacillus benzoevorans]|uniref:Competence protein ComGD n=1 Tax=Bacillus benzoevorans TaxID=1456 RepID=A0A7X0HSJ3_9BACI|nr:competence type IV pilus minor pilin ComGD [Bacillus benzoevorans]MBB6444905.1 competence protein ComGD [Bacillus benzoevorans]